MSLGYFGIRPRRYTFACVLSWMLLALGPFIAGAGLGGSIVALLMRSEPHSHGMVYGAEPRSSCWRATRASYLIDHPTCEACGRDKHHDLNVHHVVPFSRDKSLECDPENLITMCRDCHELIGHLRHFDSYNPNVRADAAVWRKKIQERP